MKVLLCHVSPRADDLAKQLSTAMPEADCFALSFESIVPQDDFGLVEALGDCIAQEGLCIAVSPSAAKLVAQASDKLTRSGSELECLGVGAGTQEILLSSNHVPANAKKSARIKLSLLAQQLNPAEAPDADRLVRLLAGGVGAAGRRAPAIWVVKGKAGRTDWIERLRLLGYLVNEVIAYRSVPQSPTRATWARFSTWLSVDTALVSDSLRIVLPSQVAIEGLNQGLNEGLNHWNPTEALPKESIAKIKASAQAYFPHPRLAQLATTMGFTRCVVYQAGLQGLINRLR